MVVCAFLSILYAKQNRVRPDGQSIPIISRVSGAYCKLRTKFFSIDLWPKREVLMEKRRIDGKKRGSVIYSTDQKNEANKMFIIWLLPVWGTGNKYRMHDFTVF